MQYGAFLRVGHVTSVPDVMLLGVALNIFIMLNGMSNAILYSGQGLIGTLRKMSFLSRHKEARLGSSLITGTPSLKGFQICYTDLFRSHLIPAKRQGAACQATSTEVLQAAAKKWKQAALLCGGRIRFQNLSSPLSYFAFRGRSRLRNPKSLDFTRHKHPNRYRSHWRCYNTVNRVLHKVSD